MKTKLIILSIILAQAIHAQRLRDFSVQTGGGFNYYFNNLELFNSYVKPINYSLYTKLMWNTRYRLSFGLEAGYTQLYRINDLNPSQNQSATIDMVTIPVHIAIEMKLTKKIYSTFSFGPSFISNHIESPKLSQTTTAFSIADMSLGLGYRHTFHNNLYLTAEIKHYYSSKFEDRNLSIPVSLGFNF